MLHAFNPTKQPGVLDPLGYWDPLGLMEEYDPSTLKPQYKSEETFRWYREAELKHGRISMVALLGLYVGTFFKWPGFENVPSGVKALEASAGGAGLGVILLIVGLIELQNGRADEGAEPGDLGNPIFFDEESKQFAQQESFTLEIRNKELAHCRLAMSALLIAVVTEYQGTSPEAYFQYENLPGLAKAAFVLLLVTSWGPRAYEEVQTWAYPEAANVAGRISAGSATSAPQLKSGA